MWLFDLTANGEEDSAEAVQFALTQFWTIQVGSTAFFIIIIEISLALLHRFFPVCITRLTD